MFDRDDRGAHTDHAAADRSFRLKPRPDNCGYVLSSTPFCRSFGISPNQTERFDAPEVNDKGMLCLDLKRTHIIAQRNPRKKGAAERNDDPTTP